MRFAISVHLSAATDELSEYEHSEHDLSELDLSELDLSEHDLSEIEPYRKGRPPGGYDLTEFTTCDGVGPPRVCDLPERAPWQHL